MKKKIIFLLSFVFIVQASDSQENFTVIKVNGNIVIERTGNSLGTGTSFSRSENLLFKIPESRAAVINPGMGRFLLTSENVSEFKDSKSNFLPSSGRMSTRAMEQNTDATDLALNLKDDYLILNENKILVDTNEYPMSGNKYFYISYDHNNKAINKKLAFNSDTLIIRKNELLTVEGKEISAPDIKYMKLMYYEEGDDYLIKPVTLFTPVFPDLNILKQEIKIIVDEMELRPYDDILREVKNFISEFYGSIDETNLKLWLKDNLGLRQ